MENDDVTHRIRQHAFLLWEAAGCPSDRAEEFWFRAREVELGLSQPATPSPDKPSSEQPSSGDFA